MAAPCPRDCWETAFDATVRCGQIASSPCRGGGWEPYPPPKPTTSHLTWERKEKAAEPQAGSCLGPPTRLRAAVPGGHVGPTSVWELGRFPL